MSYSFLVRGANKADIKAAIAAKFDEVVTQQPVHAKDRDAGVAVASAFVDMLIDPPADKQISVSVQGSLGWQADGEFTSANVDVSASVVGA